MEEVLLRVWNWLPAFREVARCQHLPTASSRLHVTASALSRTIRQLEDAVGRQLFNRVGRSLVLNSDGERLLRAIESSTRTVDDALCALASDPMTGPVRISSLGVLTNAYVLPALLSLREAHPELVPVMSNMTPADANQALVRGEIDAAFYYDPLTHDALSIDRIGQATASVYCGRGHPLFGRKRVSMEALQAHPFSVPAIGDRGVSMDGWPVEVPRQIGMQITLLTTNVEVSLGGQMLTVLPDVAAYAHVAQDKLHRLPLDIVPPVQLFAARRATDTVEGASSAVVDAVAEQVVKVDAAVAAALAKGPKS